MTGGTGSLGSVLVERLLKEGVKEVRVFSRDEFKQSVMARKITDKRVTYWIGDIRNLERLKEACARVDIIIHTAAMKRLDTISQNVYEVADININGTRNVVLVGKNCEKIIFISSDKAYLPTCAYGATKMVAEKIVLVQPNGIVWRFGNFIGSRGSVWEIFKEQSDLILKNISGVLTLTDPDATRFVMEIEEVCDYILSDVGHGLHYPKNLKSMSVLQIAKSINPYAEYKVIGLFEGEKKHEAFDESYSSDKCL